MNKKLIALAVAGACVAPTVMAQTANPVTLYGRIFVTVESVEANGGTAAQDANTGNRLRMVDQASYLGVRGSEDLGGGLKAVFQLETGFDPQQTQASYATRNSMVGIQGGWGTLAMGRWDTPMKMSMTAVDPWGDLTAGDITGANLDQGNFSRRSNNQVLYWSPNWSGFQVKMGYIPNEAKNNALNPSQLGVSLVYSKGPVYLAYAYEDHKDGIDANGAGTAANYKEEGNAVAGRFTMGNLRLSGHYGEYKKTNLPKDKSYMIGADYAMGKHMLLASYQNAEAGAADCDMYSVGYKYDWTKRTFFVASYTEVDNSNGMNCNFGTGSFGSVGQDLKGFGLGIRHLF
jgi:predicted porin